MEEMTAVIDQPTATNVTTVSQDVGQVNLDHPVTVAESKIDPLVDLKSPPSIQGDEGVSPEADDKDAEIDELIADLKEPWEEHGKASLDLRHMTGRRLNAILGSPDKRQEYGVERVKRVAKAIHVSVSEISRMRWFSRHFDSIESLKREHPNAHNWSDVKKLLAEMNKGRNEKLHYPSSNFIRALQGLVAKVGAMKSTALSDDQRKALRKVMQELKQKIEVKFNLKPGKSKGKPATAK